MKRSSRIGVCVLSLVYSTTAYTTSSRRRSHHTNNQHHRFIQHRWTIPSNTNTELCSKSNRNHLPSSERFTKQTISLRLANNNEHIDNNNNNNELAEDVEKKELGIWAARGILLVVAAVWGTNFAAVKYLEGLCFHPPCNHPPSEFAFARFAVAGLVSLPLLWGQDRKVIQAGLECGAWITLGYVTQSMALATISAGKCAFICSLTVVSVPIMALVLYGRPITKTNIVAAVIALSGVSVLEGMIDFNQLLGVAPAFADATTSSALTSSSMETASLGSSLAIGKGDLLALGQPLGYGFAFLRIEHYQEKFKDIPNRVLTIAAAQCVMVGILSLLWVLYDYHGVLPNFGYMMEGHRIATILWTGIVTTVFAIFLEGIALQTATATDAAIAFSSEPVWASIFGFLLLGEQLGTNSYIGGAIILGACLVSAISDLRAETAANRTE